MKNNNRSASGRAARLDADERRQLIIDVAQELFSQRPYSDVSMADIAEAAGISRANLNYHFGGKRDLYVVVIDNFASLPPLPRADGKRRSLRDKIDRIIDHWLDSVWENRGTFITIYQSGPVRNDPEIEDILNKGREAWSDRLADLLELPKGKGQPTQGLIHAFGVMSETAVDDWLRNERLSRQDVHVLLVETLLTISRKIVPAMRSHSSVDSDATKTASNPSYSQRWGMDDDDEVAVPRKMRKR